MLGGGIVTTYFATFQTVRLLFLLSLQEGFFFFFYKSLFLLRQRILVTLFIFVKEKRKSVVGNSVLVILTALTFREIE